MENASKRPESWFAPPRTSTTSPISERKHRDGIGEIACEEATRLRALADGLCRGQVDGDDRGIAGDDEGAQDVGDLRALDGERHGLAGRPHRALYLREAAGRKRHLLDRDVTELLLPLLRECRRGGKDERDEKRAGDDHGEPHERRGRWATWRQRRRSNSSR